MNVSSGNIKNLLKTNGHKLTKIRNSLIEIFAINKYPLSVSQILAELSRKKLKPHKTTVYREISFLKEQKIIREIQLGEDKKRYETAFGSHHHHLVCYHCDRVEDVVLDLEMEKEGVKIATHKQFKILDHSLEFFGLCANCH